MRIAKIRSCKLLTAFITMFFFSIAFQANRAEAHYLSFIPASSTTSVGAEHTAIFSFTHVFTEPQYSATFMGLDSSVFTANFLYSDGTKSAFPAFTDYKDPRGVEVDGLNAHLSKNTLSKSGTVILDGRCDIPMGPTSRYVGYAKQILNAKGDNFSTSAVGGSGVLEIVPLSDLSVAKVGEGIHFKALFKGQPLKNAEIEWADEKASVFIGDEGRENLGHLGETDGNGVFTFAPRNAGMSFLGIMYAVSSDVPGRDTDYYSCAFVFGASAKTTSDDQKIKSGGSGGCDAGFPWFFLLGAVPLAGGGIKRSVSVRHTKS